MGRLLPNGQLSSTAQQNVLRQAFETSKSNGRRPNKSFKMKFIILLVASTSTLPYLSQDESGTGQCHGELSTREGRVCRDESGIGKRRMR